MITNDLKYLQILRDYGEINKTVFLVYIPSDLSCYSTVQSVLLKSAAIYRGPSLYPHFIHPSIHSCSLSIISSLKGDIIPNLRPKSTGRSAKSRKRRRGFQFWRKDRPAIIIEMEHCKRYLRGLRKCLGYTSIISRYKKG